MNNKVYLLWSVPEGEADEEGLLVGVYASEQDAVSAIERLKGKRGFAAHPQGFQIHASELGKDRWTEGFIRD